MAADGVPMAAGAMTIADFNEACPKMPVPELLKKNYGHDSVRYVRVVDKWNSNNKKAQRVLLLAGTYALMGDLGSGKLHRLIPANKIKGCKHQLDHSNGARRVILQVEGEHDCVFEQGKHPTNPEEMSPDDIGFVTKIGPWVKYLTGEDIPVEEVPAQEENIISKADRKRKPGYGKLCDEWKTKVRKEVDKKKAKDQKKGLEARIPPQPDDLPGVESSDEEGEAIDRSKGSRAGASSHIVPCPSATLRHWPNAPQIGADSPPANALDITSVSSHRSLRNASVSRGSPGAPPADEPEDEPHMEVKHHVSYRDACTSIPLFLSETPSAYSAPRSPDPIHPAVRPAQSREPSFYRSVHPSVRPAQSREPSIHSAYPACASRQPTLHQPSIRSMSGSPARASTIRSRSPAQVSIPVIPSALRLAPARAASPGQAAHDVRGENAAMQEQIAQLQRQLGALNDNIQEVASRQLKPESQRRSARAPRAGSTSYGEVQSAGGSPHHAQTLALPVRDPLAPPFAPSNDLPTGTVLPPGKYLGPFPDDAPVRFEDGGDGTQLMTVAMPSPRGRQPELGTHPSPEAVQRLQPAVMVREIDSDIRRPSAARQHYDPVVAVRELHAQSPQMRAGSQPQYAPQPRAGSRAQQAPVEHQQQYQQQYQQMSDFLKRPDGLPEFTKGVVPVTVPQAANRNGHDTSPLAGLLTRPHPGADPFRASPDAAPPPMPGSVPQAGQSQGATVGKYEPSNLSILLQRAVRTTAAVRAGHSL
eukprot:TRINITY_DN2346_c0_g1_i1.p1 TRINITY_DN2346_c0_g1~~TRINITY_DN2346_c0_g1_i1.p1  ORF type:complete len:758 (+),score=148.96 TRINITY_DN2346_c0_g1_i1:57-2330(+)